MTPRLKKIAFIVLCALFIASCSSGNGSSDSKWVANDLQGEWEQNIPAFWPEGQTIITEKGTLVITNNTITISGPSVSLKGYTRDIELEAYTEEGKLYIKDRGAWQNPIVYTYWESGGKSPEKMLTLKVDATEETLKKNNE